MRVIEGIDVYIQSRIAANLRKTSITTYRKVLTQFLRYTHTQHITDAGDITPETISQYITARLDSGIKGSTMKTERMVITGMMQELSRRGLVAKRMWREDVSRVRANKPATRFLTTAEVRRLNDALDGLVHRHKITRARDRAIIAVLIDTGMRASELLRLTPADVNLRQRYIKISAESKSRKERLSFITAETARRISEYLTVRAKLHLVNAQLWVTDLDKPLPYCALRSMMLRASRAAGLGDVTPHWLRHTAGTMMVNLGMSIVDVAEQLGHADTRTTQIYLHISNEDRRKRFDGSGPMEHLG